MSFKSHKKGLHLPAGAVWLMNSIAEFKGKPRDRSEDEVAGYRNALQLIHKKHNSLDISPKTILELHRLSHAGSGDAGQWKKTNNDIIRVNPNGTYEIIFTPVTAAKTPKAIDKLC